MPELASLRSSADRTFFLTSGEFEIFSDHGTQRISLKIWLMNHILQPAAYIYDYKNKEQQAGDVDRKKSKDLTS
jgi:hypothetical protein